MARFESKDMAMIYCHKLNITSICLDVSYFFFYYYDSKGGCFNEFIKRDKLFLEAKKQISNRFKLIEKEKVVLDIANKLISKMEQEEA